MKDDVSPSPRSKPEAKPPFHRVGASLMATVTREEAQGTVLRGVPFHTYERLIKVWGNRHLRMAYHDGTLEIVSPRLRMHETPSYRLSVLVTAVADHLRLPYVVTASYTFRKKGVGPLKGRGKEPDESFYFAHATVLPRDRDPDLDKGDPPPDLWIEVDNRASSAGRLPTYAALGVPEVWRHRTEQKSFEFLQLVSGKYKSIESSLSLPPLTPNLVLEALSLGGDCLDSEWVQLLRDWVERTIPKPAIEP